MTLFQKQSVRLKDLIEYHTVLGTSQCTHTLELVYAQHIKM